MRFYVKSEEARAGSARASCRIKLGVDAAGLQIDRFYALVGPPRSPRAIVTRHQSDRSIPRTQILAERALATLNHYLHIEAVSGVVLLFAAALAFAWANSPAASSYDSLWHVPVSLGFGDFRFTESLHYYVNDVLMTVFFLVVGMEIRREIHEGALASLRLAALPLAAALGGIVAPALIYLSLNMDGAQSEGWAIPTATDIAFAVGVLALLGRSIPGNVRVFLLALAIIDDIVAVLVIAAFYSDGINYAGLLVAGAGILMVLALQRIGVGSAHIYVLPGAVLWIGLLWSGAHPTLAGVVLGLMTPAVSRPMRERPLDVASRAVTALHAHTTSTGIGSESVEHSLKQLRQAQREVLPPVTRVQMALHPWVAFGIMPLFALANAGVSLNGINLTVEGSQTVIIGIFLALVLGKPLGILVASWVTVRLGWCRLPDAVTWPSIFLVGLLAGIGFTMSIFIATLAFDNPSLLAAAKLGVLLASLAAGIVGLTWGWIYSRSERARTQT